MYENGENVSLTDTLVKIGTEKLGITDDDTIQDLRTHLETNAGAKNVMKEIQLGRKRYNIQGVPYFIISAVVEGESVGRPYGFSGAQDSRTFVDIFEELAGTLE
jgi:predicted DsbA family dithiol-disulfide isomerase